MIWCGNILNKNTLIVFFFNIYKNIFRIQTHQYKVISCTGITNCPCHLQHIISTFQNSLINNKFFILDQFNCFLGRFNRRLLASFVMKIVWFIRHNIRQLLQTIPVSHNKSSRCLTTNNELCISCEHTKKPILSLIVVQEFQGCQCIIISLQLAHHRHCSLCSSKPKQHL